MDLPVGAKFQHSNGKTYLVKRKWSSVAMLKQSTWVYEVSQNVMTDEGNCVRFSTTAGMLVHLEKSMELRCMDDGTLWFFVNEYEILTPQEYIQKIQQRPEEQPSEATTPTSC